MKEAVQPLIDHFIDAWIWITVGLLGITGFFGKRMLSRWDAIAESHMPSKEINDKFTEVKRQHEDILEKVSEVHNRIDELYIFLATGKINPPAHRQEKRQKGKEKIS